MYTPSLCARTCQATNNISQSKAMLAEAEDVEALLALNREKCANTDVVLLGPVRSAVLHVLFFCVALFVRSWSFTRANVIASVLGTKTC